WSKETFHQELMQPISVSNLTSRLDGQEVEMLLDFLDFAERLGDPGLDLMIGVLGQSTVRRNRRMLSDAVVARCRDNPERLAPFLADPRWHVVRNVVHMLGAIGGEPTLGLLESVLHHPEPRVRHAVIGALSQVEARAARPMLLSMLTDPDAH